METVSTAPQLVPATNAIADDYSFFGEVDAEVWSVHVAPAKKDKKWLVRVSEQGKDVPGVLRTESDFTALHESLQTAAATFSAPLPLLHVRRSLLGSSFGSKQAEDLQRYLAELVRHPEARKQAAFTTFVGRTTAAPAAPPAPDEATSEAVSGKMAPPTLVKTPSMSRNVKAEGGGSMPSPADLPAPMRQPTCTTVKLSWTDENGDHECELPVLPPTQGMGNRVIDVRTLGAKTGFFTHDPGFTSTSSCLSAITYIDGDKGVLLHRGYAIADLAAKCSFPEVAYLLIEGELPSAPELATFTAELQTHQMVHAKLVKFFDGFKSDAHPMAIMVGVVGALSAFYPDSSDISNASQRRLSAIRLVAKLPTIAAITHKTSVGQPVVYPQNHLSFAANFLHMMFATPCEPYVVNPIHATALETIFILHADHEQNASTSTVRIASSSQANPFACIAAGIASLWGPAHGGANEACLRMLDEIGTADRIPLFLAKAKDKSDPFRLMGFGHRVYKNYDPRASLMRGVCADVLATLPNKTPLLDLAEQLEAAALQDEYFVARKLYPNVDFYSGIVLSALGIPRDMFTVIFAVARCSGWLAQWNESFAEKDQRISRPRQLYVGVPQREFVPLGARGEATAAKP